MRYVVIGIPLMLTGTYQLYASTTDYIYSLSKGVPTLNFNWNYFYSLPEGYAEVSKRTPLTEAMLARYAQAIKEQIFLMLRQMKEKNF